MNSITMCSVKLLFTGMKFLKGSTPGKYSYTNIQIHKATYIMYIQIIALKCS